MHIRNRKGALALSLAISQLLAAQAVFAQDGAAPAIEEMVVTAQKREQSLQDVPIAVSAFGSDQIESRGISSIENLTALAPNIQISKAPGSATASQIAVRGSAQQNPALYWDPTVGIYVDGVYIGKSQGSIFDVIDVERIEVLRGPQGTLYGRNTLAGALSFITRKPSGEFAGSATFGLGNYDERSAKVSVDLPRFGIASVSFGLQSLQRDGWVDVDGPSREAANRDSYAGRLAVNLAFSECFEADYRFDRTDIDQKPPLNQLHRSNLDQRGIPGLFPSRDREDEAALDLDAYEKSQVDGHSLTLTWEINEQHTLKSITAYREMSWDDGIDLDGSAVPVAHTFRNSDYDQTSQELQLVGGGDRWNYVAGIYYFEDDGSTLNPQTFFFGTFNFDSRYAFTTESRAVYGQFDYQLTEALTLTAGLRYTEEEKTIDRLLGVNFATGTPFIPLVPQGTEGSEDFSSTTPLISLGYQLNDDHSVYAKYSQGFKSGGFNGEYGVVGDLSPAVVAANVAEVQTPFKPEEIKSYEIGYKGSFLDGRAQLNAAAFFNEVDDMQLSIFTAQGASASVVRNAGQAETKGIELEGVLVPVDGLRLQASYGYLDAEYKEFMDGGVDQADNRAMIHAPEHVFNLLVDARIAETQYGTWRAIADYVHKASWYPYPYQLAASGTLPAYDATQPVAGDTKVDSVGLLNLRLALTEIPLGEGEAEAALWVRNATDEEHASNFIDFGPGFGNLTTSYWQDPRMYGASVTYRW